MTIALSSSGNASVPFIDDSTLCKSDLVDHLHDKIKRIVNIEPRHEWCNAFNKSESDYIVNTRISLLKVAIDKSLHGESLENILIFMNDIAGSYAIYTSRDDK